MSTPYETERTLMAAALQYGSVVRHAEGSAIGSLADDQALISTAEAQLRLAAMAFYESRAGQSAAAGAFPPGGPGGPMTLAGVAQQHAPNLLIDEDDGFGSGLF